MLLSFIGIRTLHDSVTCGNGDGVRGGNGHHSPLTPVLLVKYSFPPPANLLVKYSLLNSHIFLTYTGLGHGDNSKVAVIRIAKLN